MPSSRRTRASTREKWDMHAVEPAHAGVDPQEVGHGRRDAGAVGCSAVAGDAAAPTRVSGPGPEQHGEGQRARVRGSIASRSDSPSSVKPSAVTAMQIPGRNASQGAIASSACA